jgi:hypothetical protein
VDILILDDFGGVCHGRKEEVMLGNTLLSKKSGLKPRLKAKSFWSGA